MLQFVYIRLLHPSSASASPSSQVLLPYKLRPVSWQVFYWATFLVTNIMGRTSIPITLLALQGLVSATGCPFADPANLHARAASVPQTSISDAIVDDSAGYLTDDVGGQISDQDSLRAGDRGPTLLEDFIFRQKITHFDHERVSFPKISHFFQAIGAPRSLAKKPAHSSKHLSQLLASANTPGAGPRTCRPRSRRRSSRHIYQLRRLEQHHRRLVSKRSRKGDARLRPVLYRSWFQG